MDVVAQKYQKLPSEILDPDHELSPLETFLLNVEFATRQVEGSPAAVEAAPGSVKHEIMSKRKALGVI